MKAIRGTARLCAVGLALPSAGHAQAVREHDAKEIAGVLYTESGGMPAFAE